MVARSGPRVPVFGDAADVVARDAAEPALADDLLAELRSFCVLSGSLRIASSGVVPSRHASASGRNADVRFAVLRHPQLHPRPRAAAVGEHGLQPRRARLVPDAGEERRPHVVGVLGLFEQPHLVREFGGNAALAVAGVAVQAVEAPQRDAGVVRGRRSARAGEPGLEERRERGRFLRIELVNRHLRRDPASRRCNRSRRRLHLIERGEHSPDASGLPFGSIAWQSTHPFRTTSLCADLRPLLVGRELLERGEFVAGLDAEERPVDIAARVPSASIFGACGHLGRHVLVGDVGTGSERCRSLPAGSGPCAASGRRGWSSAGPAGTRRAPRAASCCRARRGGTSRPDRTCRVRRSSPPA